MFTVPLRLKLLSLPMMTALGLIILVFFAYLGGQKMAGASKAMLEDNQTQSARLAKLEKVLIHLETVVLTAPIEKDAGALADLKTKFEEDAVELETILIDADHPEAGEVEAVRAAATRIFSFLEAGDVLSAGDAVKSDFFPAFHLLEERTEELRELIRETLEMHHHELEEAEAIMEMELFISAGLVLVICMGAGWWVAANVSRRTSLLNANMNTIAAGDYTKEIDCEEGDELANMTQTMEGLRESLLEAKQNARISTFRGTALQTSDAMVMMADMDFKITWTNVSLKASFTRNRSDFRTVSEQFDPDQLVGMDMDFYYAPGQREKIRAAISDVGNLPHRSQIGLGKTRYDITINSVSDEMGNPQGFVVEWYDCTRDFFNQATIDAIESSQIKVEFNADGEIQSMNAQFCDSMHQSEEQLVGRKLNDMFQFYDPEDAKMGDISRGLEAKEAVYGRFQANAQTGQAAILEGGFVPVSDKNGKLISFLLICQDVTEARLALEAEEKRREADKQAQEQVVSALGNSLTLLSQGDLTASIDTTFSQEYEDLRKNYNSTLKSLEDAFARIAVSADQINNESASISVSAQDLSKRTENQAAALEETAASIQEMTASVQAAAKNSEHAHKIVAETKDSALASSEVVRKADDAMKEIEQSSQEISAVTDLIEGISFQTNLLALNAGVEAARAGKAGRGFAVVAGEVRDLAQRSSQAASEIGALIKKSSGHVSVGTELVRQAAEALDRIAQGVTEVATNVEQIASSSREQSSGLVEIDAAMKQLDQSTQHNASMCEESTASSASLSSEAETLMASVEKFKTGSREQTMTAAADPDERAA